MPKRKSPHGDLKPSNLIFRKSMKFRDLMLDLDLAHGKDSVDPEMLKVKANVALKFVTARAGPDGGDPAVKLTAHEVAILQKLESIRKEEEPGPVPPPPRIAEFCIAWLCDPKSREAFLGDMDELYNRESADAGIGAVRAKLRYWARALACVGPLILDRLKKLGVLGLMVTFFKNISGG